MPDTTEEYHAKMEAEKYFRQQDEEVIYPVWDELEEEYMTMEEWEDLQDEFELEEEETLVSDEVGPFEHYDDDCDLSDSYRAAVKENYEANRAVALSEICEDIQDSRVLFSSEWDLMQEMAWQTAEVNGFHGEDREDGTAIALIHEELSEALWAVRHGNPGSKKLRGVTNLEEELADVIIRVMDFAQDKGYELGRTIIEKMIANTQREYLHGKEF